MLTWTPLKILSGLKVPTSSPLKILGGPKVSTSTPQKIVDWIGLWNLGFKPAKGIQHSDKKNKFKRMDSKNKERTKRRIVG